MDIKDMYKTETKSLKRARGVGFIGSEIMVYFYDKCSILNAQFSMFKEKVLIFSLEHC